MDTLKDTIKPILIKYGVTEASFFGSYGKGTADSSSDVDILFMPPKDMGIEFVELKQELEDNLNKQVDLVSYRAINPHLRESILEHQKSIL